MMSPTWVHFRGRQRIRRQLQLKWRMSVARDWGQDANYYHYDYDYYPYHLASLGIEALAQRERIWANLLQLYRALQRMCALNSSPGANNFQCASTGILMRTTAMNIIPNLKRRADERGDCAHC